MPRPDEEGKFVTVVGPVRYIGERKLSWFEFLKGLGYVARRYLASKFFGPRYIFSATVPKHVAFAAMLSVEKHGIRCPAKMEIPFSLPRIKEAVRVLTSHRAKGRIVINFEQQNAPV